MTIIQELRGLLKNAERLELLQVSMSPEKLRALIECAEALEKMVDRWEPDTSGTDRVMWENATEALAKLRGTP